MLAWLKNAWSAPPAYPPAPDGLTIYAIGDIHGRLDLLAGLHARIDDDAAAARGRVLEIYLGDYVDRGSDSSGVMDLLTARRATRPTVLLRGNHEEALEAFLEGRLALDQWRAIGGGETLLSYGVPRELLASEQGSAAVRSWLRGTFPGSHGVLLRAMRPYHEVGPYLFVHAGIEPGVPLQAQDRDKMMWVREPFLNHAGDFGHIVVHGHTPAAEPEFRANRINIDTGAYVSNRLTCLRIDGRGAAVLGMPGDD